VSNRDPQPGWGRNWTVEQLAEFLDLISSAPDEGSAMRAAVSGTCDAFAADVAAILREGRIAASIGFDRSDAALADLEAVVSGRAETVAMGEGGKCVALAFPIPDPGHEQHLVIARAGDEDFSREECNLLRGMARTLAMGLQLLRSISEERALRHRTETEVKVRQKAEADYRNLVERLPAIVYTSEVGAEGRWRYVSPQIEEILGYSPDEWLADPTLWARQLHPDDRERVLALEAEDTAGPVPPVDYRMLTRDGEVVWVLDEAAHQRDDSGVPVWHGVLYDITARKQAEHELERRAAQQAGVAGLGERALEGADPAALMDSAVSVVAEIEGVEHSCIWELPPHSRTLRLRAGLELARDDSAGRITATRD
jgi:PAS domain S-box-containing protein